jgi:hypothetical protein
MERDVNYTNREKAILQHDFRISFFFLILFAEIVGFNEESIFHYSEGYTN